MNRKSLSIAILTKNEAQRIAACIASAQFADEVVVVDSGSTDETVAIARSLGAEVYIHADWQGFAVQRNRLLQHVSKDYVFFLDADEVITPQLQAALEQTLQSTQAAQGVVGSIAWIPYAFGRRMPQTDQGRLDRLFPRAQLIGFEGVVHEGAKLVSPLPVVKLQGGLIHHSRETIRDSLEKLKQYALLGAAKRAAQGKRGGVLRGLGSGLAAFIRLYVLRRGFLAGGPGFLFCFFVALECFFRYAALAYDRPYLTSNVGRN